MAYTRAAVERAMKVQEAILRALSGRQSWWQVADVLGVSPRTVRRLRLRYEQYGYDGLFDHRRRRPSPRAVPLAEVQQLPEAGTRFAAAAMPAARPPLADQPRGLQRALHEAVRQAHAVVPARHVVEVPDVETRVAVARAVALAVQPQNALHLG